MPDLVTMGTQERNEHLHKFSHDLKNRLGALWQAVNLLHELPRGPEHDELVALAEKSYFAGALELERLLDGFAVPRGVETPNPIAQELLPVLDRAAASMAFRTGPKQQRFVIDANIGRPVLADPFLLTRLVEALFSNASKFSPPGTVIQVSATSSPSTMSLVVKDDGVGMTDADLQHVFTRYAILSSRSTSGESQARGTLQRARQWAEAQGGGLHAASDGPGLGSTFMLTLPLADQAT